MHVTSADYFFFQAEDGIRDHCVTGLQSCALPISARANDALRINGRELRAKVVGEGGNLGLTQRGRVERSEERRVGKEGRSRGGPEHVRNKRSRGWARPIDRKR